jgi:hypothetical protein
MLPTTQLNIILFSLVGSHEYVKLWWDSTNKAFGDKTPNEVYNSGDTGKQQITDYLLKFTSGDYL